MSYTVYAYSRRVLNDTGAAMHLALRSPDGSFTELHGGFPILSPKASFSEGPMDGQTMALRQPELLRDADGGFIVLAPRLRLVGGQAQAEGHDKGQVLCFSSRDLISYTEMGMRERASLPPSAAREEIPCWDADLASPLPISEGEAKRLLTRFTRPSAAPSREYDFPFMPCRGDPMALREGKNYLFMATDDEHGQNYLKVRAAGRLADIARAKDVVLFEARPDGELSGCLWAPELHRVSGALCLFFAAGSPHWYTVKSQVMVLRGEDPLNPEHWGKPRPVLRADLSPLCPEGHISLDMTVIHASDAYYVVWSQRHILIDPIRCGTADLYIAKLNPKEPWRLDSDPVLLSRPEYSWERAHSAVNEGPFALIKNGRIFLSYSAALIDATYCVGLLCARDGAKLLEASSWEKCNYPLLHRLSHAGEIGAGHNSFLSEEDGTDYILYHSLSMRNYRMDPGDGRRYPAVRQVLWDEEGFPHF